MLSTPLDIKKEEGRVPHFISACTLPIQRIAYKEEVPYRRCGRVEWAGKFSSKFSGLSETVPDTHDTIFTRVKIATSIGVSSVVYEYTQEMIS